MKRRFLIGFCALVLVMPVVAQQRETTATKKNLEEQRQAANKERRGSIQGRVISDSGQPLPFVGVNVLPTGTATGNRRAAGTDEEGKFEVDDLPPAAYTVMPQVPGYIPAPVNAANPNERRTYRIGETATITMIKGGVITGAVKTAAGEPVINVPVRLLRVKDENGKPTRSQGFVRDRQTDDRGVYRLYGLEPGSYLVFAGGASSYYSGYNKYGEDVPTYYPSATRDAAVEVIVQAGQETSGIDIGYRGDKGHAVSGAIRSASPPGANLVVSAYLLQATTGLMEATAIMPTPGDRRVFAFYGVADGDYYLVAEMYSYPSEKEHAAAQVRRISVKGADVTGLELALSPLATLVGRVVLEPLAAAAKAKCEGVREANVEETTLAFLRETRGEVQTPGWLRGTVSASVDDKGAFAAYRLHADRYRVEVNLPGDHLYVRSMTMGDAARGATLARNAQTNDLITKGIALKSGDKVENLTITIAEGGASISGKVLAATEAEKLPTRLRVYAVPAERERADEVLRYAEAEVGAEATYRLAHLAPGKYWLLVKAISEEEEATRQWRAAYWEAAGRLALRKEAEAAATSSELAGCQQVKDLRLRYSPSPTTAKPPVKK